VIDKTISMDTQEHSGKGMPDGNSKKAEKAFFVPEKGVSVQRYRTLSGPLRWIFISFSLVGIFVAIYYLFHFEFLGCHGG